jgi:hypothetical protein
LASAASSGLASFFLLASSLASMCANDGRIW